jgi:alkylhydroperoxidase/carboxymuconolactone decarboxylase family protein YurZ
MTSRSDLQRTGEAVQRELFGETAERPWGGHRDVGLTQLMSELVYGSIWTRPGLSRENRMICTLSALCCRQYLTQLRQHVAAAIDIGITPQAIVEIFIQCGIYAGFPASDEALRAVKGVLESRGVTLRLSERTDDLATLFGRGNQMMRRLHGERSTQGYGSPNNPITSALYPLVVQHCYGEIWDRPGLDIRTRALCGVASFAALGLSVQLRKFALSARNVGLTETEIVEAIIQIGPYAGFASALNGLSDLSEVLR